MLVALLSLSLQSGCLAAAGVGPGRGAWQSMDPAALGLSAAALRRASTELHDAAAIRNCTLIVKDGYIIHEHYDAASSAESTFESDSMGKTAMAAIIGLAEYRGLIDIDKPVQEYNVSREQADWNATGYDYYPQLTVRHLLSQATGYGRVAPGSFLCVK
jgi:CubicO group peptidase (beta-lactamase class C family)